VYECRKSQYVFGSLRPCSWLIPRNTPLLHAYYRTNNLVALGQAVGLRA